MFCSLGGRGDQTLISVLPMGCRADALFAWVGVGVKLFKFQRYGCEWSLRFTPSPWTLQCVNIPKYLLVVLGRLRTLCSINPLM